MSYMKKTKASRVKQEAVVPEEGMIAAEGRDPIYEFDDVNDVATISAQIIMEKLKEGGEFNFQSYRILQSSANDEVNMSDCVIIISAAVLNRIGANKAAKGVLSESDEAADYYKSLGLEGKATLSTFVSLLTIVCPELLKATELAIISLMSQTSKRTKVSHTTSRMTTALAGAMDSGLMPEIDVELSSLLANFSIVGSKAALAHKLLTDSDSKEISPIESASNPSTRPVSISGNSLPTDTGMELTTRNLMSYARAKATGPVKDFDEVFRPNRKPLNIKSNKPKSKKGLGYVEEADSDTEIELSTSSSKLHDKGKVSKRNVAKSKSQIKEKMKEMMAELEEISVSGSLHGEGVASDSSLSSI